MLRSFHPIEVVGITIKKKKKKKTPVTNDLPGRPWNKCLSNLF